MFRRIRSAARDLTFPVWSVPIALLALTLLSYGLRAFSLGFFWDDWPYLWFFHRFGPQGIIEAFTGDRPFLSFIYTLSLTAFGASSQAWQAFAIAARWLCGLGLWLALAAAWPRHSHKAAWAAFLFVIYPGFTQHWIALIYGQAFFLFAAVFFSIALTLWLAQRHRIEQKKQSTGVKAAWTLLALGLSAFTMFSTEYFFGLELLRPVLLWILFYNAADGALNNRRALLQSFRRAVRWWLPYLALILLFIFWRAVLHPFTGYGLTTLRAASTSPLSALRDLSLTILHDLIVAGVAAWGQPLQTLATPYAEGVTYGLRLLAVTVFTAALFWLFFWKLRPGNWAGQQTSAAQAAAPLPPQPAVTTVTRRGERWALQAGLAGAAALLVSGWPTWLTGLPMRMGFPQDRYALALSVGVCILLAALIDSVGKDLFRKAAAIGLVIGLSAGFHFQTALAYEQEWAQLRNFFWQLAWRAPAIAPDTLLATVNLPFRYNEDDSLTAPLNWMYDPQSNQRQIPYLLYDLKVRNKSMPYTEPGQPLERTFRTVTFSGSTSQMLLFSYASPGCLHILDSQYDAELYRLPNRLLALMHLSNPASLITETDLPAMPPANLFGVEPSRRWCYYYQKASLARQQEQWETVISLSRQSANLGLKPEDPAEYLPFIEGYARAGFLDDALQRTISTEDGAPALRPALCAIWKRTAAAGISISDRIRDRLETHVQCVIP